VQGPRIADLQVDLCHEQTLLHMEGLCRRLSQLILGCFGWVLAVARGRPGASAACKGGNMATKVAGTLVFLMAFSSAAVAQDAKTVVQHALKAMGGTNLKTLEFSGSGSRADQLKDGNTPGPRVLVKSYIYDVDYTIPASRVEAIAIQGIPPMQTIGEEGHGLQYVNAGGSEWYAWDVGGLPGLRVPERPKDWLEIPFPPSVKKPGDPIRQPDGDGLQSHSEMDRVEQIWLTPHGFLIGAMKANDTSVTQQTMNGMKFQAVSWTGPNRAKITGYIGEDNMVARVETMMDHPMYGDEHVVRTYDYYEYRDGLQFPAHMGETITTPALMGDKGKGLELFITSVKPNVAVDLSVPQGVMETPVAPPATVMMQKIGEGLYYLAGQNDCSLVVEFKDFIALVEGPLNDARSLALISEIKKLVPNKPIRYVINTHPHVDHTGGVRTFAAMGATIVTQQANVPFIEALLKTPHTIIPDTLQKTSGGRFRVEGVEASREITDGSRKLEIYHMKDNLHSSAMLMTYLPKEKILTEGDPWTPGMVAVKATDKPYQRCCDAQNIYDNVKRLNLDVKTIAPIHGRVDTWGHLLEYLGLPAEGVAQK
jgi:glyoxylase-like metal-dependent hydrolase (beta-lactamase superfamily II)